MINTSYRNKQFYYLVIKLQGLSVDLFDKDHTRTLALLHRLPILVPSLDLILSYWVQLSHIVSPCSRSGLVNAN